ncbi:OmpA family protein [Parvibaculum lavamentivorans]|nr:OmpA family protein [Parvibaculum lavamentivorans]
MTFNTGKAPAARGAATLLAFVLLLAIGNGAKAAEAPLAPPEQALLRIMFEPDESALSQGARDKLVAFAKDFTSRSGRLELKAYAGPPHDKSSAARRLSLRRALSVRRELMASGIVVERIQVRALGGTSDSGHPDRVDIKLFGG